MGKNDSAWSLSVPQGAAAQLARAQLWLGMAALIGSGVLAVVLVLSRTPGIGTVLPSLQNIFRAALVVHVDLSVLVWFMAFAAVLWSATAAPRWVWLGWVGWGLAALGTVMLTVSPFLPGATALLNNYIPVLAQPLFMAGLMACAVGFGIAIARALIFIRPHADQAQGERALRLGVRLAAAAGALAWMSFAWTWLHMPALEGVAYFEVLFWGAGHVLQFQHALLAGVAWLWLSQHLGAQSANSPGAQATAWAMAAAAAPLAAVPVVYWLWPAGHPEHFTAFAQLMRYGHLCLLPLGALLLPTLSGVWRAAVSPERAALLASLLLFSAGGVLAFMIRGINVVVPAHYHGSIVGVTLAFMGLTFGMLPGLGWRRPLPRWARWQPMVYGGGQLMHILGLAWSGGYGVQRKVGGTQQVLSSLSEKIGMGMMGLGGLIAIVGGLMFVLACILVMRNRPLGGSDPADASPSARAT